MKQATVATVALLVLSVGACGSPSEPEAEPASSSSLATAAATPTPDPAVTPDPEPTSPPADEATEDTSQEAEPADTFTMPNLVGKNLQDAQDELQLLGSYLLTQNDATGLGRFQVLDSNWQVCSQEQGPGSEIDIATMVVLEAVKLGESCP